VRGGLYDPTWGCCCEGRTALVPDMRDLEEATGESL
jgi:hypothetical protein